MEYISLTGYYTLPAEIPEKVAFIQALDARLVFSEIPFLTLNQKAQGLVGHIEKRILKLIKEYEYNGKTTTEEKKS